MPTYKITCVTTQRIVMGVDVEVEAVDEDAARAHVEEMLAEGDLSLDDDSYEISFDSDGLDIDEVEEITAEESAA